MKRTIIFEKKVLVQQAISVEYESEEQLDEALDGITDTYGDIKNDIDGIAYEFENTYGLKVLETNEEYDIVEEPLEYYDDFEEDEE